jgi:glucose-6-phosphate dehydrogenase assembly protein OpcA
MMNLDTSILGEEVPLRQVEKSVRALWADSTAGKTRASLMNFVIYSEDPASLERNTRFMAHITREHACRALLIVNEPALEPAPTRAWITAHCQLYDGRRSVCCEQISFLLQNGAADSLRNVIFSHVESDLPLVVWWQGELTERLDERLYSVLDGLIVDSSVWENPAASLRTLMSARQSPTARFTVGDLGWMRSHVLRLTLAAAFQNGALKAALPRLTALRVIHAPGHRTDAMLLAAWVGTQLRATFKRQGADMVFQCANGANLTVTLQQGGQGCPLQSLTLEGPDASVSVSRDTGCNLVRAATRCATSETENVQPVLRDDDADLIADQLSRLGGTTRYFETLSLLMQMLED